MLNSCGLKYAMARLVGRCRPRIRFLKILGSFFDVLIKGLKYLMY